MNKKFTFMVAALLAAGSFSANAQTTVDNISGLDKSQYYHLVLSGNGDTYDDNDVFVSMSISEQNGEIEYKADKNRTQVEVEDANLWTVKTAKESGKTVVTLVNKATGKALAFLSDDLLSNAAQYSNENVDVTLDIEGKNLKFAESKYLGWSNTNSGELDIVATGATTILLVSPKNTDAETENITALANLGSGISLAFEGTPTGTDVFQGVTVVPTAVNATTFYLVKGTPVYKNGSLDIENNTFVVLSATSGITGQTAPNGCTYTTVKGDKFGKSFKEGGYPSANAVFTAKYNVNKVGKIALAQTNVSVVESNEWQSKTNKVFVSATGNAGAALVNAQSLESNAAWLTPSLGTAVDVKSLVKGQWIVNILASDDKSSAEMVRVVYSTQATSSSSSVAEITTKTSETNKHKDAIYSQWIVSADKDANTVTFFNRETGAKIEKVTLFKTPKANVYTASTSTNALFNDKFIELRTVENATQFDGYLNLDKEGLDSEYTLSVNANDAFANYEVPVLAKNIASSGSGAADKSVLVKAENKDATNVFTFKLAQSKDSDSKLDTIFVNEVTYNFYKDGKLTTAKDTLKAISYNFAGLKNANKNTTNTDKDNDVVTADFELDYSKRTTTPAVASGNFVFRKVGSKYQIVKAQEDVYASDFVNLSSNTFGNDGVINATDATAPVLFTLNPVAIAPSYDVPESHIALEINGAYLGSKADGNAIMTNDTLMLKSTAVDAAFSFYAFSADKEAAKTPSYYLSSNGKMMNDSKAEIDAINKELEGLSEVFDAEKIKELKAKKATYYTANNDLLVKFQQAKYVDAEHIALAKDTVKGDALKSYKFNVLDFDGQAVLKNANAGYVQVLNDAVVFTSDVKKAAKFDVVAAEAPTSNEGVSATEVKVVANNGSIVVKNAAGKNVVVSTILGQVVANEVLTSDNATINVPAGIVVVAVDGESFKVNVK